jgi:uncharacterized Tic20 family protein
MITVRAFENAHTEHEDEKASNSYLMSLIAIIVGLPIPIINLIATLIFYLSNRKSSYYVRWHCTQALLSQLCLLFVNSYGFWWSMSIIFSDEQISNHYIAYIFTAITFNIFEFITTIITAINVRKGKHTEWWLISDLSYLICKP